MTFSKDVSSTPDWRVLIWSSSVRCGLAWLVGWVISNAVTHSSLNITTNEGCQNNSSAGWIKLSLLSNTCTCSAHFAVRISRTKWIKILSGTRTVWRRKSSSLLPLQNIQLSSTRTAPVAPSTPTSDPLSTTNNCRSINMVKRRVEGVDTTSTVCPVRRLVSGVLY